MSRQSPHRSTELEMSTQELEADEYFQEYASIIKELTSSGESKPGKQHVSVAQFRNVIQQN